MMKKTANKVLMIAARRPVAGETKTRLGTAIGHDNAAKLYRAFLQDLVNRFQTADLPYDVVWTHTPESARFEEVIRDLIPEYVGDIRCVEQAGPDWMTRQDNLMRWAVDAGYDCSILTASDSPHMSRAMVDEGFAALEKTPLALGKVHDGGYYLIGMSGFVEILTEIPMSTADTAQTLVEVAREKGFGLTEITPTFDVDVVEDFELLRATLESNPEAAPYTQTALDNWQCSIKNS